MAHRIITQVVLTGSRVFGRAFAEAWKQAAASQKHKAAELKRPGGAARAAATSSAGLTMDEACKILNVAPPKGGKADMDHVYERFKKLFDLNEPKRGGSFYLQSKILRARERIEAEVRAAEEEATHERYRKGDYWDGPKIYKDKPRPIGRGGLAAAKAISGQDYYRPKRGRPD
ncbi:Pam16-domain-containing protein [Lineolata rhizophorae]|uniref:Mitochondrial import inner membrane translocase subunit TIM16 n=1 Tax=Lineolata rhizophorae TaxID=578093 RepID=A0A6A6P2C9_9PEZI|nr:Pam16-domain-containing protein [Lineolata rhizophorae]